MNSLDWQAVEYALRSLISSIDYDKHKLLEEDEEDGEDKYPELVDDFIHYYTESLSEVV